MTPLIRALAAVAALTVAAGWSIHAVTGKLGTASAPFVVDWWPEVHPLGIVSLAVAAAFVALVPRLLSPGLPAPAFVSALFGTAIALGLAINLIKYGVDSWDRIFDTGPGGSFEAKHEYLPGLGALANGVPEYLDRFAERVPSAPINVAGHPPAPLLLLHALGISTPAGHAALCILLGATGAPLTYLLTRMLAQERPARLAGALYAASPSAILFGFTSYDYAYAAIGVAAAALLLASRPALRWAGALAAAVAALFSWALLAIAFWAALVTWRREGVAAGLRQASACAVAFVALNLALVLGYGYDPLGTLQATEAVYRDSLASIRPYAFWVLGAPVAWALMLGPAVAAGAAAALERRRAEAIALAAVVVVAAVGGFTKAENERIWLFMVPLACAAGAPRLLRVRPRLLLGGLVAQALAVQALFDTIW